MFKYIEKKLDSMTSYKVVVYSLSTMIVFSIVLSFFGVLPFTTGSILLSVFFIFIGAASSHFLFTVIFKAPSNIESSVITALILLLIINPAQNINSALILLGISFGSIALKYLVVYKKRHVFNPAALTIFLVGLVGYTEVVWWVGSRYMFFVVLLAGTMVAMKMRKTNLVSVYIAVSSLIAIVWFFGLRSPVDTVITHFLSWPTIFFATIMLTEPLGLPSTGNRQYVYAVIAATFGTIPFSFGILHGTPELSLLIANLYTLIIDRPKRYVFDFEKKTDVGGKVVEYVFKYRKGIHFLPGQYMEWSLPHRIADQRGIRRYLSLSGRPGREEVSFAVRHVDSQSSWKRHLSTLNKGEKIFAAQLRGDFVLRSNSKPIFIAGGIGITPFMSMVRSAVFNRSRLDVILFYANKTAHDVAFLDELEESKEIGLNIVHVLDEKAIDFVCEEGKFSEHILLKYVPDLAGRTFYISGPSAFVDHCKNELRRAGVKDRNIVTDYFSGLA